MICSRDRENNFLTAENLELPGSPISLNSRFYIERPPTEALVYTEISKPGSLIRIRAPRKMGKSSLMLRLLNQAATLGYCTATIDFQQAETAIFESSDKFLRWMCSNLARQLKLAPSLDEYWDEGMGSKVSCTIYLEGYLLGQINAPLVLALNEVNRLFEYPDIAQDFFSLLRFWHEQARTVEVWQQLRLVLVHSTEIYASLSINQSPFNVGLTLKLQEFTDEQAQDLSQRFQLNLSKNQIQQLTKMVGGHPYLVHMAFYNLCCYKGTLEKLLQEAPTYTGIYSDHLRNLWLTVEKQSELAAALQEVIETEASIELEPLISYQLERLGLIKLEGNNCIVSCDLYRLYFRQLNLANKNKTVLRIEELQQENQKLQSLMYLDTVTQVANRLKFDRYLEIELQDVYRQTVPISLIICDIDYFKIYNDTYGHKAGDNCLRHVAQGIAQVVKYPSQLVARYGGDEFVIVLTQTDAREAMNIAEKIRLRIQKIALPFATTKFLCLPDSIVSLSLGVASTIITQDNQLQTLFVEADKALYESKRKGRNCATLSSVLNFKF